MINISTNRKKYILTPTIPAGTEEIGYEVVIGGDIVFVGNTKYFGGTYEVDCSDWLESYLASRTTQMIITVTVTVTFTYDGSSTQVMTLTWTPDSINLTQPTFLTPPYAYIQLMNCGFLFNPVATIQVPLSFKNGILDGKTIDSLEKVTYMDKWGDIHNGGMTNHYELECYIDPCWFQVETGKDLEYAKVILALQNSQMSSLNINGVKISGMDVTGSASLIGRVKDVEQIDTYSSYSTDKKVPTYKIIFEIYK